MSASYNILRLAPLNPILLRVVTAGGRRLRHAFTRWGYLGLLMMVLLIALVSSSTNAGSQSLSDLANSYAVVDGMRPIPLTIGAVRPLVLAAAVGLLPALEAEIPLKELLLTVLRAMR